MPTRASKKLPTPRPRRAPTDADDPTEAALRVVEQTIGEPLTDRRKAASEAARALSALGASKGGKARAAKLSDRRRKAIAKKAAKARWGDRTARE